MLETISKTLLSLVFPLHCQLCGELLPSEKTGGVCLSCERSVPLILPPHCPRCGRTVPFENENCGHCSDERFAFDRAFACVLYDAPAKELLHRFKFGRKRYLLPFFSERMIRFASRYLTPETWDWVLPVPMHPKTKFERGFNQSELLSSALAGHFGRPHSSRILSCRLSERPQAALKKNDRKTNVRGLFFVKKPGEPRAKNVLLVDDILTTGQTASACAKALKGAGARTVTVLAFARGA